MARGHTRFAALMAMAMALLAACATTSAPEMAAQPKSLAWVQGCWASQADPGQPGMTLSLLADPQSGGMISGTIHETVDGAANPTLALTFSHDGLGFSFGAPPQAQTDAFLLSPYRETAYDIEPTRRVHPTPAERARHISLPLYAVFQSAFSGERIFIVGDGANLGIYAVRANGEPGETFFSGARTPCSDSDLLRLNDTGA